jgi:TMEM175 potassium channel family protein
MFEFLVHTAGRPRHSHPVSKERLQAFSDGVFAIIITIMVLELRPPHGTDYTALRPLLPLFLCYVLSFVFLGIYWNNHHHMLHAVQRISGPDLWANLHLLFWLSLIPFVTGWMGENRFAPWPVAFYGAVLICCAIAYTILQRSLIAHHSKNAGLARDVKGKMSILLYAAAIPLAFVDPMISCALYVAVAIMWLAPDRRIETRATEHAL